MKLGPLKRGLNEVGKGLHLKSNGHNTDKGEGELRSMRGQGNKHEGGNGERFLQGAILAVLNQDWGVIWIMPAGKGMR